MSQEKLHKDAARAAQAQHLLNDDILQAAFTSLETAYVDRWRATHIDDDKGREKLFIAVNVVGKVKEHLSRVVEDGRVAKSELDVLAKEAERKKLFGII